jgi:hypothetical protein
MSTYATVPGIITVDALRSQVGNPTADAREPSAVTDEEFGEIIQRIEKTVERRVMNRLEKRVLQDTPVSASHVFEEQEVSLSPADVFASGQIDGTYYPLTYQNATTPDGKVFTFDPNLEAQTAGYFDRQRFKFVGDRVLVMPKDTDKITLRLPNKTETNKTVGADVIDNANQQIKQEARQMVEAKASVGASLERPDNDQ